MRFSKELYPKVSLLKAAYAFTDRAYIHLDADESNYYVTLAAKDGEQPIPDGEFENEMLCQSVRHEIYLQTKTIRELLMARAMASTVLIADDARQDDTLLLQSSSSAESKEDAIPDEADEASILSDWFDNVDA